MFEKAQYKCYLYEVLTREHLQEQVWTRNQLDIRVTGAKIRSLGSIMQSNSITAMLHA